MFAVAEVGSRPNLLLIVADDMRFDLKADILQQNDIFGAYPEQARTMDGLIHEWLSGLKEPLTSQQQDYDELLKGTSK